MLKRLLFFALAAFIFGLRANGADGEMELPAADAEQVVVEQPLLPPSPDTADGETQMPLPDRLPSEDATNNPQQAM